PDISAADCRDRDALAAHCQRLKVSVKPSWGWGKLLLEIFEATAEDGLVQPTFITHYPVEVSPLARESDSEPGITDRFELFIGGKELANGFSELNDPEDQAARFRAQVEAKAAGDDEAMHYDADYIRALEVGMPPTGGLGVGIDRLVMLLTGSSSIRDVLLFPYMRPSGTAPGRPGRAASARFPPVLSYSRMLAPQNGGPGRARVARALTTGGTRVPCRDRSRWGQESREHRHRRRPDFGPHDAAAHPRGHQSRARGAGLQRPAGSAALVRGQSPGPAAARLPHAGDGRSGVRPTLPPPDAAPRRADRAGDRGRRRADPAGGTRCRRDRLPGQAGAPTRAARALPQPAATPPAGGVGQAARAFTRAAAALKHARGRG